MVLEIFQDSRKNEKEKGKEINTERDKIESRFVHQILKALLIDRYHQIDRGCCLT